MAKQRDVVRMSEAEIAAFLEGRRSMNVASLLKDGSPHLTTLWFAVKDGVYLFETYGTSQKVVNLRRDPRIALLWEAGEAYDELVGVSVRGRAEIVETEPQLSELMAFIVRRNLSQLGGQLDEHVARMVAKRVVVAVRPEKTISWDHRKLAARA
ncbi:MAG: putative FMN-binding protein [Phenylobacterium sp.]|nr:putative FMN-binding protein [Phenylobacterium sp.]